jgi:hypothetical protein
MGLCLKYIFISSTDLSGTFLIFYWNLNFLDRYLKNVEMSNFLEVYSVGAELFHAGSQRDRHDGINNRFSQFWESV